MTPGTAGELPPVSDGDGGDEAGRVVVGAKIEVFDAPDAETNDGGTDNDGKDADRSGEDAAENTGRVTGAVNAAVLDCFEGMKEDEEGSRGGILLFPCKIVLRMSLLGSTSPVVRGVPGRDRRGDGALKVASAKDTFDEADAAAGSAMTSRRR